MTEYNIFMQEVAVLKQAVQEAGRIRNYSEKEFDELINIKLSEREQWAASNSQEIHRYYQSLSFKEKAILKYTINESVEGLGILGKIITDQDITEVMINGFDTIFIEKKVS